jgi:hypothetical protein
MDLFVSRNTSPISANVSGQLLISRVTGHCGHLSGLRVYQDLGQGVSDRMLFLMQ